MAFKREAEHPGRRDGGVVSNPGAAGLRWRLPVLLAGLAVLMAMGLLGLDRYVERNVQDHLPDWLHWTADGISLLGSSGLYATVAGILLVWFWRIRPDRWLWQVCLWLLLAEGLAAVVVRVLKIGIGRWRPNRPLAGQFDFFDWSVLTDSKRHSFPSGHTADAAAVAAVIWFACPKLRPFCVAWVVLMGASRVCALQHFVGDVAAGAMLGILCALAMGRKLNAIARRVWSGQTT